MWIREIKIVINGCEYWDGCFFFGFQNYSIKSVCLYVFIIGKLFLFKDLKLFELGMFINIGVKEERIFIMVKLNMYS